MSDELAEGWATSTIEEIAELNPRHARDLAPDLPVTFIPMSAVAEDGWSLRSSKVRPVNEVRTGFTHFADGDVLFAKITPCMENGKAAVARGLANGLGYGTTELHVLRPRGGIDPMFLYYFMHQESFRREAAQNFTGTAGQLRVPKSFLREAEIPLPPAPEQRRIAIKLDEILSGVAACQKRLEKVPVLLKRFRQSVLAAACSGRLTEDWRDANPAEESATALLGRIRALRTAAAKSTKEQAQIEAAFATPMCRVDAEEVGFDKPDSWALCRVGAIGTVCNGSTPSRKEPKYWGGKIPWISSGEVRNNLISATRERITRIGYESSSVRLLPVGTVLLAMIGEGKTRGQTAILGIEATINQNAAAVVLDHGLLVSAYLWRWFQHRYELTRERGSGSGPQALNCQRVREIPLALPPLIEQKVIVRRVEELFALADQIEGRETKAEAQVEQIAASLLAKAFRGELVPTEAELARTEERDYEPASVLLDKIRASRAPENTGRAQRRNAAPPPTRARRRA